MTKQELYLQLNIDEDTIKRLDPIISEILNINDEELEEIESVLRHRLNK